MTERISSRSSRIRALAALLAFGLAANTAWSAGLGRLTVRSALGQPLRAEVEIASLTRDEAATISARLASPEAFRQAGLELTPAVAGLRFSIDRREDGRAVVLVSSSQPIGEPFLDLVIELSWANGRFVRGYTFLLDPPELRTARREVVEGAAVQPVVVPPRVTAATEPVSPAPPPASAARASSRDPKTPPAQAAGDRVPVGPGVTLRSIAQRVRPEGVTLEQAQVALYRANPSAFLGSIHGLRADATLVVPDRASMLAIDPAQARAEALGAAPSAAAERPRAVEGGKPASPSAGQMNDGTSVARPEDRKAPSRDRLKLSGPQTAGGSKPAAPEASASVGTTPPGRATGQDGPLGEFQSRISEIEKSIAEMQRLLELKNRQLAELQKQIEAARAAGRSATAAADPRIAGSAPATSSTSPPAGTASSSVAAAPMSPPTPSGSGTPVSPPVAVPPENAQAGVVSPTPGTPSAPAQAPQAAAAEAKSAPAPSAPPGPKPAVAAPPVVPTTQPGFVADLLQQPLTLPALGSVALLVVGYAWYAIRRRRRTEHFEDSLVSADGLAANSLFGSTGGQSVDTGDDTFGRGSAGTGVDIHAAEVDPIAEAEVYIAYGREAQAEEILREALQRQPERQALRAKLMEIHADRHDVAAFVQLAEEMFAATGGRNEEWTRIVAMGEALDPAHPLFARTGALHEPEPEVGERLDAILTPAAPVPIAASTRPATEPEPAIPLEPMIEFGPTEMRGGGRWSAEPGEAGKAGSPRSEPLAPVSTSVPELPVDGPELSASQPTSTSRPAPDEPSGLTAPKPVPEMAPLEFAPLEFDLGLPGEKATPARIDAPGPEPEAAPTLSGRDEPSIPVPDLSLDFPVPEAGPTEAPSVGRSELEKAIDGRFELPSLDLTGVPDLPATAGKTLPGDPPVADFSAMRFDLEPAAVIDTPEDARGHDLATRLDLAAAFAEIGDKAGARELLEQVLEEGDSQLRERARSMLDALG